MRITTVGLYLSTTGADVPASISYTSVSIKKTEPVELVTSGGSRQLLSVPISGTSYELEDMRLSNTGASPILVALYWGTGTDGVLLRSTTLAPGASMEWISGTGWIGISYTAQGVTINGTAIPDGGSASLADLHIAASGVNSDITELRGLTVPMSVVQGGTGATDASSARTSLGLVIGVDVQGYSSHLSSLAALSGPGYAKQLSDGSWSSTSTIPFSDLSGKPTSLSGYGIADAASLLDVADGIFIKADYDSVAFTKTAAGTVSIKAGTRVGLGGAIYTFASATAVTMPTLTAGTDYAIYICSDGTLQASANFSYPSGYSASTSRKIGGFHYAPGGNATAQAGGDSTPAINAYSLWDLKWRPACNNPRGMTLVANRFWCDIYLTNTNVDVNGSSAYGVTIADGLSPPKIPSTFGGNGSTAYGSLTRFEAAEVLAAVGKELLNYEEFSAAAYGTTEGTNVAESADPVNTGLDAVHTSKWGVMQSTGNMWVWGRDFSYRADGADVATLEAWAWKNNTNGHGQIYAQSTYGLVSAIFGGSWNFGSYCGSRSSYWNSLPWDSASLIGARGRCDHLRLV